MKVILRRLLHFSAKNELLRGSAVAVTRRFSAGPNEVARTGIEDVKRSYAKLRTNIKNEFEAKHRIDPTDIFAINQIDLQSINVYGFDYDYTLAEYSDHMEEFIYRKAVEILCDRDHFPDELKDLPYIPNFCIRGLHYDIQRGLVMKIDDRHFVQEDTVYRGKRKLSAKEVAKELDHTMHISKRTMDKSCFRDSEHLMQLTDIFSKPEMLLLVNAIHYFTTNGIKYNASTVFKRIEHAVSSVHTKGHLHREVSANVEKYLKKDCLRPLMQRLQDAEKSVFLLTNSGFPCVDVGLRHMIGDDWRQLFDVVAVEARKPEFFENDAKPFRRVILGSRDNQTSEVDVSWDTLKELKRGEVYCEGSCNELMRLTEWKGEEVIYFGDQIYADLHNPSLSNGWSTCAVIPEIVHEVEVMNSDEFVRNVVWVQALECLINRIQHYRDGESRDLVQKWLEERAEVKRELKEVFNERFGSIFRSRLQGTYFSARLSRVADLYTSSVRNLERYGDDHIFFPIRGSLPHEDLVGTAYRYDGYDAALQKLSEEEEE